MAKKTAKKKRSNVGLGPAGVESYGAGRGLHRGGKRVKDDRGGRGKGVVFLGWGDGHKKTVRK